MSQLQAESIHARYHVAGRFHLRNMCRLLFQLMWRPRWQKLLNQERFRRAGVVGRGDQDDRDGRQQASIRSAVAKQYGEGALDYKLQPRSSSTV